MYERGKLSPSLFVESVPVEVEPWRKALMDAAEYMRAHGHCKSVCEDNLGRVCMVGAIIKVTSYSKFGADAHMRLADFLGMNVGGWNDRESTTHDQAIRALTDCARS